MVTIFKNFNEVVEHKTISTILEEIKTGKYRPGIIYLRKSLSEKTPVKEKICFVVVLLSLLPYILKK